MYQVDNLDPTLGCVPIFLRRPETANNAQEFFTEPEKGHLANVQAPSLLHFAPETETAHGGAVLICPGGGYQILSMTKEGSAVARWLNTLGFHVFVLKYRLGEYRHPHQLQDVTRAMRLIRTHAGQWKIDPQRIGAMGFSAGGHLVSMLSTQFASDLGREGDALDAVDARPDWAALIYPVISSDPAIAHAGSLQVLVGKDASRELAATVSTELLVTPSTPPTFLLHAQDDRTVSFEHSVRYHTALQRSQVATHFHILSHGGHGFGLGGPPSPAADWRESFVSWLEAQKIPFFTPSRNG